MASGFYSKIQLYLNLWLFVSQASRFILSNSGKISEDLDFFKKSNMRQ